MQKSENLFVTFSFVEMGSGANPPGGAAGRRAGGSLRLIAPSMGPGFQEGDPQISKWDPQLITVVYWV
jgi:hypothetical protein